jgi:hypothetical protein
LDRHRAPTARRECHQAVIAGLDPAIRLLLKKLLRRRMDARIKSGHDEMRRMGNYWQSSKLESGGTVDAQACWLSAARNNN